MINEELPAQEKKELDIDEFLRQFALKINRRFSDYEDNIISLKKSINRIDEKIASLEARTEEISEREKRISRDILAIID